MELFFIRHGETEGNRLDQYVGKTDLPLNENGISGAQERARSGDYPQVSCVHVSPQQRARKTAEILFPSAEQIVVPDLREMDFGDFEGRNSSELKEDPAYIAWVDADCLPSCPNGESGEDFERRTLDALSELVEEALEKGIERLVIVAHGGVGMTIMANLARPKLPFYRWWIPNCGGFRIRIDSCDWEQGHFSSWEAVGRDRWHNRAYSFFQNSECEHFPCHEAERLEDFNCLFCFCPLYHLGAECEGTPTFAEDGIMDCSACTFPHRRDSYGLITERLERK